MIRWTLVLLFFTSLSLFFLTSKAQEQDPMLVYISCYNPNITSYTLNQQTGKLDFVSSSNGESNPSWLAFHPNNDNVYAVNELSPSGLVLAFFINHTNGILNKINSFPSGGGSPAFVSVHPSGKWVYVANYDDGYISVFNVSQADGSLTAIIQHLKPGEHAHMTVTDPSGKYLFVPCLGSDYIAQYIVDERTGFISPNSPSTAPSARGAGPRHLAFHPSGTMAYVVNELDSTVTSYEFNDDIGLLSPIQVQSTLPSGSNSTGNSGAEIVVSRDGRFVYATNRGHNSVAIFGVDATTRLLRPIGWETGGGKINTPRGFGIDPTGNFAIVANQNAGYVLVFRINRDLGTLSLASTLYGPTASVFVGFHQM